MNKKQKSLLWIAPTLPFLLFLVLFPISIAVFGCAGNLETEFDGNWVNRVILWPVTLLISLIIIFFASRWLNKTKRWIYLILGGIIQIILSMIWGMVIVM